jgi:NCAIR mutase (PurE)-related protein
LREARVIIAATGIGALVGVIAGLTAAPAIALSTSPGYGLGGLSAILGMLSHAPGISAGIYTGLKCKPVFGIADTGTYFCTCFGFTESS